MSTTDGTVPRRTTADASTTTMPSPPLSSFNTKVSPPLPLHRSLSHDLSSQMAAMGTLDATRAISLFERFLSALHTVSCETSLKATCDLILTQACLVLDCERATLFLINRETGELEQIDSGSGAGSAEEGSVVVSPTSAEPEPKRVLRGKGLAGHVAATGETLLIPDVTSDSRWNSTHDAEEENGKKTRDVIACCVRDKAGEITGVLMAINKKGGAFLEGVGTPATSPTASSPTSSPASPSSSSSSATIFDALDRVLCENFASHIGLIIRNCQLYEESVRAQAKLTILLDIVNLLHSQDTNTNSLIFTLTNHAHTLIDGERSTLYLVHAPTDTLVVQQGSLDIRIPISREGRGLASFVAATGETVNIEDCYRDERFDQSQDKKSGYRTKQMICVPIKGVIRKKASGSSNTSVPSIGREHSLSSSASSSRPNSRPHSPSRGNPNLSSRPSLTQSFAPPVVSSGAPASGGAATASASSSSSSTLALSSTSPSLLPSAAPSTNIDPNLPQVIGVLQIINHSSSSARRFTSHDEYLLRTLLDLASPILVASSFFTHQSAVLSEADRIRSSPSVSPRGSLTTINPSGLLLSKHHSHNLQTTSPGMGRVTEAENEPADDENENELQQQAQH